MHFLPSFSKTAFLTYVSLWCPFTKTLHTFESKNQSEEADNFIVWQSKSLYIGAKHFHHSADSECRLMSPLYHQILVKWPFFMNKWTNLMNKCHLSKLVWSETLSKMHLAVLNALTVIAETTHYNLTCLPNFYLERSAIYKKHSIWILVFPFSSFLLFHVNNRFRYTSCTFTKFSRLWNQKTKDLLSFMHLSGHLHSWMLKEVLVCLFFWILHSICFIISVFDSTNFYQGK